MPPAIIPSDDEYVSEEDSDFAPDAAPTAGREDSSDEESETEESAATTKKPTPNKRKREQDEETEDLGFENSGDEAIIEKGVKMQRRRKGKSKEELEDEGGEEGLIKTRSQRAQEKVERKPIANTSAATIDVDAVWQAMISAKPNAPPPKPTTEQFSKLSPSRPSSPELKLSTPAVQNTSLESRSPSTLDDGPDSKVMIKRTYNFAGKIHTEQKLVPRDSAEAKLFLASQPLPSATSPPPGDSPFTKPKRPLKKARRSIFEPVIEGLPQRTDLFFGTRRESDVQLLAGPAKIKKFNTVEKSAMDWAGFVDKEGIADELDAAGKSKGAYRARQEFLARVEQKKEEDARRARGLPV
ncbi:hypothetical protein QTJ16_000885 [Diplocarpon rosae]|uniref:SWR1-complex protein 5 n=1 Tax=Diplocarpon rosae TaxID=946125 RepID=A0AAD9T7V2_9HELO|nr:hypothetical protein QTJ16_000885 [Diplocarpon rosae]PBP15862.1 SWR1-complex protein 5 [Diplocarpon rosae]